MVKNQNGDLWLSLDPAFRNVGWVKATVINPFTPEAQARVLSAGVLDELVKPHRLKTITDWRQGRFINTQLKQLVHDVDYVAYEWPYGSRSARAAWTLGFIAGILCTFEIPEERQYPALATHVKKVVRQYASKVEMVEWAKHQYPELRWHDYEVKQWEHIADALAVLQYVISGKYVAR